MSNEPLIGIAASIEEARTEATRCASSDPTYAEIMLTYVELGEQIAAVDENECRALMTRLLQLERPLEFEQQQRWARWCVLNMNLEGVAE